MFRFSVKTSHLHKFDQHYELRFPRITKYYLPSERVWKEAPDLQEIHGAALESVGRDRTDKDILDWVKTAWGKTASPKANCSLRRQEKADYWVDKLARMDRNTGFQYDISPTPTRRRRSENEAPDGNSRMYVRLKTDSHPLAARTNTVQNSNSKPSSPSGFREVERQWKESLVWFAPQAGKDLFACPSVAAWKKRIPRERRLHSLDSLLMGCGEGRYGKQGVIIVDECDENGTKWKEVIAERVGEIPARSILIYGCRTGLM